MGAAAKKGTLDFGSLKELLAPLAERNGFKRFDGNAVLDKLMQIAGIDLDSIARRIAADSALSSKILDNYMMTSERATEMFDMSQLVQLLSGSCRVYIAPSL